MMTQRTLLLSLFAISALAYVVPKSNNLFLGKRVPGDSYIGTTNVSAIPEEATSQNDGKNDDGIVTMQAYVNSLTYNITYIELIDLNKNGEGGVAKLVEGGIGSDHFTIDFENRDNRPIEFMMNYYGIYSTDLAIKLHESR